MFLSSMRTSVLPGSWAGKNDPPDHILLESADPLNGVVREEFGRVDPAEPNARRACRNRNSSRITGGGGADATGGGVEIYFLKDLGSR